MSKLSDFYAAVSEQRAMLKKQFAEDHCLAVSTKPGSHSPVQVSIDAMAGLIVAGTHRVATTSETEGFHAAQALARSRSVPVDGLEAARALYYAITAEGGKKK
jgi:hypothetical protein